MTAVIDPYDLHGRDYELALDRIRAAGATAVRTNLSWYATAPRRRPAKWNPRNFRDPAYDWSGFDARVKLISEHGLEPIVAVNDAPTWARLDDEANSPPRIAPLRQFMKAAAERYDSKTDAVLRVRFWQVWVEPNVDRFFSPKSVGGAANVPTYYGRMVSAVATAVHSVDPDDSIIAGGLSPFTVANSYVQTIGPFAFMRKMLCMSAANHPTPTCSARVKFDIWAHHPYTTGGPTHRAYNHNDASLGDLPRMHDLLTAARRSGHIVGRSEPLFWVTEFSWDTSPPDPTAVPIRLQARWVAEAMYRMWQAGVSLVTWLMLRDEGDPPKFSYQSGLWFRGSGALRTDRPKPTLTAFRFPFVAFQEGGRISYWGRTPGGRPGAVIVEQKLGNRWRRVHVAKADRFGIVRGDYVSAATRGYVRGRLSNGEKSLPFSLVVPPDRQVRPFGD